MKLKCDILLSTSAFEFNLRRYPVLMPVLAAALRVVVNQWTPQRTVRSCRKTVPVLKNNVRENGDVL